MKRTSILYYRTYYNMAYSLGMFNLLISIGKKINVRKINPLQLKNDVLAVFGLLPDTRLSKIQIQK